MKHAIAATVLLLAFSVMAIAHGNEKHIKGTVKGISGNSITIETTSKESVSVDVSDKTKFEKSGSPATLEELKVGDKVVIHADETGGKLVANTIRFGAQKAK